VNPFDRQYLMVVWFVRIVVVVALLAALFA